MAKDQCATAWEDEGTTNERVITKKHNNPPPDPFDAVKAKIDDLYMEAKNWLDGAAVDSPELAEGIATLLNALRSAEKEADELRKSEKAKLDKLIADIQEKYAPLIADTTKKKGKTTLAIEACKKALGPWQAKLLTEQEAKAKAARERAEKAAREAEAARLAAAQADNLEATARAQEAQEHARRTEGAAQAAANATPKVKNSAGRAIGLRTFYIPTIADSVVAARHFWVTNKAPFEQFILSLATKAIAEGAREIPGITITEEHRSV
jgi:hypothetical protein